MTNSLHCVSQRMWARSLATLIVCSFLGGHAQSTMETFPTCMSVPGLPRGQLSYQGALLTAHTTFDMSGRVDIYSHIKLLTNSRNGKFSTLSFSLSSPRLTSTRSGRSARKSPQTFSLTHWQTFSGISSEYPSPYPVYSGNLHTISVPPSS